MKIDYRVFQFTMSSNYSAMFVELGILDLAVRYDLIDLFSDHLQTARSNDGCSAGLESKTWF